MPGELTRTYKRHERMYFRGKLPPHVQVRWRRNHGHDAVVTWWNYGEFITLDIDPRYKRSPWVWNYLLLHEMAHLAVGHSHGTTWKREMNRLARLGAFCEAPRE